VGQIKLPKWAKPSCQKQQSTWSKNFSGIDINHVVSRRFAKKQQMQWKLRGAAFSRRVPNGPICRELLPYETQYLSVVAQFRRQPTPAGQVLNWVCRDKADCLNLTQHRLELSPA
jgi:hypothetical protein